MLTNDIISDLVQGLQKIFGCTIEQIILYGSAARNEATAESDIDIALVLTNEMDDKMKKQFFIWSSDMDLKYNKIFSFIDINKQRMNQWGQVLPFYRNIQKEGIVLWKAA
jgi:Predicted nucleotidyltransferases